MVNTMGRNVLHRGSPRTKGRIWAHRPTRHDKPSKVDKKKRKSTQTNSMASSISTSSMVHTDTDSTKACEPPLETPGLTPPGVRFAPVPPPTPEQEGENFLHANTERVPNLPPTSIPKKAGNALQTCQEETEALFI